MAVRIAVSGSFPAVAAGSGGAPGARCTSGRRTIPTDGSSHPLLGLMGKALVATIDPVGQTTLPQHELPPVIAQRKADAAGAHVARLHVALKRLETRCCARELALERLSAALSILRSANRALTEENSLLRLEVERLKGHAVSPCM